MDNLSSDQGNARGAIRIGFHSDQMVLMMARRGGWTRRLVAKDTQNKAKLKGNYQARVHSDQNGFCGSQTGGLTGFRWPKALKRKLENSSGQPGDLLQNRHSDSLKAKLNLLFNIFIVFYNK
jgi:hypothetical protein